MNAEQRKRLREAAKQAQSPYATLEQRELYYQAIHPILCIALLDQQAQLATTIDTLKTALERIAQCPPTSSPGDMARAVLATLKETQ